MNGLFVRAEDFSLRAYGLAFTRFFGPLFHPVRTFRYSDIKNRKQDSLRSIL